MYDQICTGMSAAKVTNLDCAYSTMKDEEILDSQSRRKDPHLWSFCQNALEPRDVCEIIQPFLFVQRSACAAFVLLNQASKLGDVLPTACKHLPPIGFADCRSIRDRACVRDEFNAREGIAIDLIANDVIIMPMGVDHIFDGLICQLAQGCEQLSCCVEAGVGIDNDDIIVIDNEDIVRIERHQRRISANCSVDAVGDPLNGKLFQ
jgi:hypothetical protein